MVKTAIIIAMATRLYTSKIIIIIKTDWLGYKNNTRKATNCFTKM